MTAVAVRRLTAADAAPWLAMRQALYHDGGDELATEIGAMLAGDGWAAFGAVAADGTLVGFIELFERNAAESCETTPVTFVEGLFVAPAWRRQGIARQLLAAAVAWGHSRGRSEIASDTQLWNVASQAAHRALGFVEVERLVAFRMAMPG